MKVTAPLVVRDLHDTHPDDYSPDTFDVACAVDGKLCYSDELFTTRSAAEDYIARLVQFGLPQAIERGDMVVAEKEQA